ncbi:MAG: hypothetical protein J5760_03465, partial [Clostridia bacterium]|nr:hypothetical protein [Clostridia bacterium]
SNVIGKANQSSAQQIAMNGIKSALLMTNTATLPDHTIVLVDSDKKASTKPDYGFEYNGNALEQVVIYDGDNFKTALTSGADTLLINNELVKITGTAAAATYDSNAKYYTRTGSEDTGYTYTKVIVEDQDDLDAITAYTCTFKVDEVFASILNTANNVSNKAVTADIGTDGVMVITIATETPKNYSAYTSVDLAKNIVILVDMVK